MAERNSFRMAGSAIRRHICTSGTSPAGLQPWRAQRLALVGSQHKQLPLQQIILSSAGTGFFCPAVTAHSEMAKLKGRSKAARAQKTRRERWSDADIYNQISSRTLESQ